MFSPTPIRLALPGDDTALDALLDSLPEISAVFILDLGGQEQQPYLARCANLRRRAKRVLRPASGGSKSLSLRGIAKEAIYWPVGSTLDASLILLEQARNCFPSRYRRMLRLRFPSYIRLLRSNRFPRAQITQHPAEADASFGPFLYRAQAEDFLSKTLDQFQIRRCDEELSPAPEHPGCIYGEMKSCLRPCQAAVSDERYREEARAFLEYLASRGESIREVLQRQRAQASDDLDFELAARLHKRLQKLDECWRPANDFLGLLDGFHGVAITCCVEPGSVTLWPVWDGMLRPGVTLALAKLQPKEIGRALETSVNGQLPESMETKRELLAVLTKWRHSTWCDGEWVQIEFADRPPFRKIVNAVKRVHTARFGVTHSPEPAETAHSLKES